MYSNILYTSPYCKCNQALKVRTMVEKYSLYDPPVHKFNIAVAAHCRTSKRQFTGHGNVHFEPLFRVSAFGYWDIHLHFEMV